MSFIEENPITLKEGEMSMSDRIADLQAQLAAVVEEVEQEIRVVAAASPRGSKDDYYRGRLSGLLYIRHSSLTDIPAAGAKLERAEYVAPLYEKFRLASARLNIVANWLENTHAPGSEAARSARIYADAAKKVLDDGLSALLREWEGK